MRAKTLSIDCDPATAQALGEAIRNFAHAAYPVGGSECSQVAREALLDTAAACSAHPGGELVLRRRQLSQLRSAVTWFYEDRADPVGDRLARLLQQPDA